MNKNKKVLRVVGCIIEHDETILMLFRSKVETNPSLWGIPAGKVENGESDIEAAIREIKEETGIVLNEQDIMYAGELPIEYPDFTVIFPVFKAILEQKPTVTLSPREHSDHKWLPPKDVLDLPNLMQDVDIIIEKFALSPSTPHSD